jgi:integrase
MTTRRSRGDGGLYWSESRQRWIAEITVSYAPSGKRITRKGSGKTKTEAKAKLKANLRDHEDGITVDPGNYTVSQAVNDWLEYGLTGRDPQTVITNTIHCRTHIIPDLGARKLRDLKADDVEKWLKVKSATLSTRTLQALYSCLNRVVKRAMAREKVKRNVVELCAIPQGQGGRPSRSLTFPQAAAILKASENHRMHAYIVVSLLTGARTEELRDLRWDHVDLVGEPAALGMPEVPPYIAVWRSVRAGGDTKTKKSRRTLALPARAIEALKQQKIQQKKERKEAGSRWKEHGLVFTSRVGTPLDAAGVRRQFRDAIRGVKGIYADSWTPRELRHSFVSLLSDGGLSVDEIAKLAGHSSSAVTETVYRHQIRPVIQTGALAMDRIFEERPER